VFGVSGCVMKSMMAGFRTSAQAHPVAPPVNWNP
jgi:hypothetical protein